MTQRYEIAPATVASTAITETVTRTTRERFAFKSSDIFGAISTKRGSLCLARALGTALPDRRWLRNNVASLQ
jgi:hypothetical protein